MAFFTYSQNNSGGSFRAPAAFVIIEARNADEANRIAEEVYGLYFDDDLEIDCECCGQRWDRPGGDGDEAPSLYGDPLKVEHPYDTRNGYQIVVSKDRKESFIYQSCREEKIAYIAIRYANGENVTHYAQ